MFNVEEELEKFTVRGNVRLTNLYDRLNEICVEINKSPSLSFLDNVISSFREFFDEAIREKQVIPYSLMVGTITESLNSCDRKVAAEMNRAPFWMIPQLKDSVDLAPFVTNIELPGMISFDVNISRADLDCLRDKLGENIRYSIRNKFPNN